MATKSIPLKLPPLPGDEWLEPKAVAGHFGLSAHSAYRWLRDGTIPRDYIRYSGEWFIWIHPAAIPLLEKTFNEARNVRL